VKFLADMGISMATVRALREAGEEVVHLRDEGLHKMPDDLILDKAIRERRVIFDIRPGLWRPSRREPRRRPERDSVRTRNQTPNAITPKLFQVIRTSRIALEAGAILIVEDSGFRLRYLPIGRSEPGGSR